MGIINVYFSYHMLQQRDFIESSVQPDHYIFMGKLGDIKLLTEVQSVSKAGFYTRNTVDVLKRLKGI